MDFIENLWENGSMKSAFVLLIRFFAAVVGISLWAGIGAELVSNKNQELTQAQKLKKNQMILVSLNADEIVFHEVGRGGLFFAETEVTRNQWRVFVESGAEDVAKAPFSQGGDHPVVGVPFEAAKAFCSWLTREGRAVGSLTSEQICRLPTNLEWGAAAGLLHAFEGASPLDRQLEVERCFGWGTNWPPIGRMANLAEVLGGGDGWSHTSPAGSFVGVANAGDHGILDLVGNAWEWTDDRSISEGNSLRGGSFTSFRKSELLVAYEYRVPQGFTAASFGFRPVLEDLGLARRDTESRVASALKEGQSVRDQFLPPELVGEGDFNAVENPVAVYSKAPEMIALAEQDFLIGKMEVRVREFYEYITSEKLEWAGRPRFRQLADEAVVGVSKVEAEGYCRWITSRFAEQGFEYRLPTNEEWSLAAKGSGEQNFIWGGAWPPPPNSGNFEASKISGYYDRYSYTAPVGELAAAPSGCLGLAGNATEWVSDVDGPQAIARGGSWADWQSEKLASRYQRRIEGGKASGITGFRLVLAPIVAEGGTQ